MYKVCVGVKGGTLVANEFSGTDPVVMRKRRKKVAGAVAGQRERGGPAEGNSSHPGPRCIPPLHTVLGPFREKAPFSTQK